MSWGRSYRNWGVRRLMTYKAASDWEANTKPIRGDKNGTKPLGDRKKKYFNIRREGDDIVVRMYNTDIVRYHPDDTLTVTNGGWASSSTHDMFAMLIGLSMHTQHGKTWVSCYKRTDEGTSVEDLTYGEYPFPSNTPVKAYPQRNGWELEGLGTSVVHHIRRKVANDVRKRYADFKQYLSGMVKLRTEIIHQPQWNAPDNMVEVIRVTREELEQNNMAGPDGVIGARFSHASRANNFRGFMLSDRAEDNYRAFLYLVRAASYSRHWIPQQGILVEPRLMMTTLDELILFIHRDEVLEAKPAPVGKPSRDRYAHWMG